MISSLICTRCKMDIPELMDKLEYQTRTICIWKKGNEILPYCSRPCLDKDLHRKVKDIDKCGECGVTLIEED